jgi:NodT family efflux transporter outer membrane factor (OMF) lipoprotein
MRIPTLAPFATRRTSSGRATVRCVLACVLRQVPPPYTACCAGSLVFALSLCGCTPLTEYIHNGFKVGPNYHKPPAPVAKEWIDAADQRVRTESDDLSKWWTVFNDPVLDSLVCSAYRQNLTLRQAGFQILMARAQRNIAIGGLFPQTQQATGDYNRNAISREDANRQNTTTFARQFYPQWDLGFSLSWELDFWGRFRRTVESAQDTLDASVENYDAVLVTLLGDVATAYVQIRTLEAQIRLTQANVALQRKTLEIAGARFKGGTTTELDVDQAQSNLSQTESQIPQLKIQLRQANNQLSILLGIPPEDLLPRLATTGIPTAPVDVAVGIPADLLRRRPDVRRAERQAAAQSAQIGIAEAEFYPHLFLNGEFGYSAAHFNQLFRPTAFLGTFGPAFQWNILNYGRILYNVRAQDAQFQALVAAYQNTVLTAGQEVENGLVTFLEAQAQVKFLAESVKAAEKAVTVALAQYTGGTVDFNRVALVEQNLVTQQNLLAQARGSIALGLIQVYRALGGGWQIRCTGCEPNELPPQAAPRPFGEELPAPLPVTELSPGPQVESLPPAADAQSSPPRARLEILFIEK